MSRPHDRLALVAGASFIVLAVSGLLDDSGLLPHVWWWPVGVILIGLAVLAARGSVLGLLRPPAERPDQVDSGI